MVDKVVHITEQAETIKAEIQADDNQRYGFKITYTDPELEAYNKEEEEKIQDITIHTITDKDWITDQLSEQQIEAIAENGKIREINVPEDQVNHEIRKQS